MIHTLPAVQSVLVVEDNTAIRQTLARMLSEHGYIVSEAPDGECALRRLYTSPERLVALVDLRMPGMDVAALLQAIAFRRTLATRHAYILMASSHESALLREFDSLLMRLHVVMLPEPFDTDRLVSAVEQAAARLVNRVE